MSGAIGASGMGGPGKPFDFGDLLDEFIAEEREKNTWTVKIPKSFTQDEMNSLMEGIQYHLKAALPPMSQVIITDCPTKFITGLKEFGTTLENKTIHYI